MILKTDPEKSEAICKKNPGTLERPGRQRPGKVKMQPGQGSGPPSRGSAGDVTGSCQGPWQGWHHFEGLSSVRSGSSLSLFFLCDQLRKQ